MLLQRVKRGSVTIDDQITGAIGRGLVIFVAIGPDDEQRDLEQMSDKVRNLRIFEDADGRMNVSALDLHRADAPIGFLVVSQFTLYGDVRKGRRPSFIGAAPPGKARAMLLQFVAMLGNDGPGVEQGIFGAEMVVSLENDGPVTIWIDSNDLRGPRKRSSQPEREGS